MSSAPKLLVEGVTRQPLPYGLFSVLTPRADSDVHWQNGVEWETLGCDPVSGIGDPSCDPEVATTGLPKNLDVDMGELGDATPFTVYATYGPCTPVINGFDYYQQQADLRLMAREEARVEQALWTGDLDNGGFAGGAVDLNSAGAADPVSAIGLLEQHIATAYGSVGVIHMTRAAANAAIALGAVYKSGNKLLTNLDTPVVAGAGYPGSSPAGAAAAAGESWAYATPALLGYRSDIFPGANPAEAGFDRSTNDMVAVAERTYAIGYDPCGVGAVRTTLGCACD